MPTVTLDEAEWQFIVNVLYQANGPGISMAMVQPLVVKIAQQLPKTAPGQPVRPNPKPDGKAARQ